MDRVTTGALVAAVNAAVSGAGGEAGRRRSAHWPAGCGDAARPNRRAVSPSR